MLPCSFLLIDFECTCDKPMFAREDMEIIEIGAVIGLLDHTAFRLLDKRSFYVQPQIYPQLTAFCTELTGISQQQTDAAPPLADVLLRFSQWLEPYRPVAWGSWGKFDATQLALECEQKAIASPLAGMPHLNIRQLFARQHGQRPDLNTALQLTGLTFAGHPHCGADDAFNTGRILHQDQSLRDAVSGCLAE